MTDITTTESNVAASETTETASVTTTAEKTYSKTELDGIVKRLTLQHANELANLKPKLDLLDQFQQKVEAEMPIADQLKRAKAETKALVDKHAAEIAKANERFQKSLINAELAKVTAKSKHPEIVAQLLAPRIKVDPDEKLYAIDDDNNPISIAELETSFFAKYPELGQTQQGGAGTASNARPAIMQKPKAPGNPREFERFIRNK